MSQNSKLLSVSGITHFESYGLAISHHVSTLVDLYTIYMFCTLILRNICVVICCHHVMCTMLGVYTSIRIGMYKSGTNRLVWGGGGGGVGIQNYSCIA